jgi:hypothetical protein
MAPSRSVFTLLLLFVGLPLFAQEETKGTPAEPTDAAEVRAQISAVEKLMPTLPDRGAALYFLAAAKQHLGEMREVLALLKECTALKEGFDPSGEPAFLALKGSKEFDELVERVHRDFPVVAQAHQAFLAEEKDLIPEGLAYDPAQNLFYLGSLNRRKIVKVDPDSRVSDFVSSDRYNLLPVVGIRLDPSDGTVWADSFEDSGQSELLHFDASGDLLGRFAPSGPGKHGLNDLVVRKNGEVIATDSLSNQVFRFVPPAKTFDRIFVHRALFYPNGIALADDSGMLYVADSLGVVAVDLSNGASHEVSPGPHTTLAGIDGLYWHNGSLIAVQNGIGSPRIAAFRLSKDGLRVTQTTVLENRTAFTVLPTTGALHGSDFYFIANSQVDNLNGDHVMDITKLEPVRIAVVHVP